MPCYDPLIAFIKPFSKSKNGKMDITFNSKYAGVSNSIQIPCGKCIGCRLARSKEWAIRCVHEASLWDDNCFITLTYKDSLLPYGGNLVKDHFQRFMKRLRKKYGDGIRYYMCGEYGSKRKRPHFHAILFNFNFTDKILLKEQRGNRLFISPSLSKLWRYGDHVIGDVTYESSAYVARYILKKQRDLEDYKMFLPDSNEVLVLNKEYTDMSRRPGIAKRWFEKYNCDVFPSDYIVHMGIKQKPPRYYEKLYEIDDACGLKQIKEKRKVFALQNEVSVERLKSIKRCKEIAVKKLKRGIEE